MSWTRIGTSSTSPPSCGPCARPLGRLLRRSSTLASEPASCRPPIGRARRSAAWPGGFACSGTASARSGRRGGRGRGRGGDRIRHCLGRRTAQRSEAGRRAGGGAGQSRPDAWAFEDLLRSRERQAEQPAHGFPGGVLKRRRGCYPRSSLAKSPRPTSMQPPAKPRCPSMAPAGTRRPGGTWGRTPSALPTVTSNGRPRSCSVTTRQTCAAMPRRSSMRCGPSMASSCAPRSATEAEQRPARRSTC